MMRIWPLKRKKGIAFHIPEKCWLASRSEEVFVKDDEGEIWQVLDCTHLGKGRVQYLTENPMTDRRRIL